ncbi:MAG TPA: DUF1634 domain-containing protein [Thermoanaerobaculia bacterium]
MKELGEHEPPWVDAAISHLLRGGVVASLAVVLCGLVLTFIHHPQYMTSHTALGGLTDPDAAYPHSIREVATQLREGRGQAVVILGLLLLIATPVVRVAFSIVAFALERDRLYVAITSIVLTLLIVSFFVGGAG